MMGPFVAKEDNSLGFMASVLIANSKAKKNLFSVTITEIFFLSLK